MDGTATTVVSLPNAGTLTVKQDALICATSPGIGSLHAWQIRFGEEAWAANSANTTVVSYSPPIITAMASFQWPFEFTEGGNLVTIEGHHFGPPSSERGIHGIGNVVYGNTVQFGLATDGCQGICALSWLFVATDCSVVSDSRMDCLTGPGKVCS